MNKKLKIAFFLDNFFPQVNGVVTSSINTVFEFNRRNHKVCGVVSHSSKNLNLSEDYFPFQTFYQKGTEAYFYPDFTFTFPFSQKIKKSIIDFKPDIIHFHAPLTIGYQAIRLANKLNIPVIGTFHTFFAEPEYLSVIGMKDNKFLYNFGWWYSNQFFNRCTAIVSPAKATAKILLQNNLKSSVHVIPNGVDVQKYKNFRFKENLVDIKINKNENWIVFIGRLSKEKCIDVLLKASAIAMSKDKSIRLLIIGDGPYKTELIDMTKSLNINNKVLFSGMIPNKNLLESGLLKKMKLFATPSTSENQPMTILESMMFGLPIIGVDAKGVPEMIENNGYIVRPNDYESMAECILKIIKNKSIHSSFSKESLKLINKYDIRETTNKMENLYFDLHEKNIGK